MQFGFCNSTQIPSRLQKGDIPATFNAYCSKAKCAIFACANTTFVTSCTRSCTLSTWTFFFPLPWQLLQLVPCSLCPLQSATRKPEKSCLVPHPPDSQKHNPVACFRNEQSINSFLETIKYLGKKEFHTEEYTVAEEMPTHKFRWFLGEL